MTATCLNAEICHVLLKFGANKGLTNAKGETPFETAIEEIKRTTQFEGIFDLHTIGEYKFVEKCPNLVTLHLLMRDPSKLIGGILYPRIFFRLQFTTEVSKDICETIMPKFVNRVPLDYEEANIFLLDKVPKNEVPTQIYKSYAWGWQQQMRAICDVMERGLPPTEPKVQAEIDYFNKHYNSFYKEKGGRLIHGLMAVVDTVREKSKEDRDGCFEECHGEELEKLPAMEILDDDFLFVNHFFLSYCVTPGIQIVVPEVKVLPSASKRPAPGSPKAGPSDVKKVVA